MNYSVRCGNEKTVEILSQLLDLIASRHGIYFQKRCRRFGVVRFQLEPHVRLTQIRHPVDPKPVRTKLENTAVIFLFDQRQRECIAIKCHRLSVSVRRTFDRDVCAAGKLRALDVCYHNLNVAPEPRTYNDARHF